jgi:hypothetical protein
VITVTVELVDWDPSIEMLEGLPEEHAQLSRSADLILFLMRAAFDARTQQPPGPDRDRLLERLEYCIWRTAVDAITGTEPTLQ